MSLSELADIAARHVTDKWNYHWYAGPYADNLSYLRERSFDLLEIGVGGYTDPSAGGNSLRAWKEYFPKVRIAGLDYYDKRAHADDRIKIYQGSQADPVAIAAVLKDFPQGFDVIIDDGSHRCEHVISTFLMLWQYVKPEGWYVIEDLQTSYWPNHGGLLHERNSPRTSMGFLKALVDGLNWQEQHQPGYQPSAFDKEIVAMSFYHNMCFLRKGDNAKGSTEVKENRIAGV